MKKTILHNTQGTTLLECVLALAVFTLVSTMAAMMLSSASMIQRRSADTDVAVNIAGDQAELAVTQPVAPGTDTLTLSFLNAGGNVVATQQVRFVKYTAPVQGQAASGKTITVWRMGIPNPTAAP